MTKFAAWLNKQKNLIHKPESFWFHAIIPGLPIGIASILCPVVAILGAWLFLEYEKNEDTHIPKDRMYQDIQGTILGVLLFGFITHIVEGIV